MKRLWTINIIILVCLVCFTCCQKNSAVSEEVIPCHPNTFVDRKQFTSIISSKITKNRPTLNKIRAGIVPHHLVADYMIKDFFTAISREKPSTIILVGPNHHNLGAKIITGFYGWQTTTGNVISERLIINELVEQGIAVCDEKVLAQEHSIGNLVPFIKYYLPETKVVPIIFHHDVSLEEVDMVLETIQPFIKKDVMIVASIDFSHYLSRVDAELMDEQTKKVLEDFDYTTLYHMDNDYLDSPASLAFFLRYMEKRSDTKIEILNNTNSGEILNSEVIETTSYFTIVGVDE